jgi:hypothetical protein
MITDTFDPIATQEEDQSFLYEFSSERFFYEDLDIEEDDLALLDNTSFFHSNMHKGIPYELRTDQILNDAIQNATNGRLETPSVLLYLKDDLPKREPRINGFFLSLFDNPHFTNLIENDQEPDAKEFLSIVLLSYMNDPDLHDEARERMSAGEAPSTIFRDLVKRGAQIARQTS